MPPYKLGCAVNSLLLETKVIPFAIKNLLNEERCFGGGQPCGLAAASAWGRRPPKAGGGPTKYHQLALRNSMREGRVLAHNSRLTHAAERMAAKEPPSTARRPKLANSPRRCGIRLPIPPS